MPRELRNAVITHVSYVDKGANKKKFFLLKSEEEKEPDFELEVQITKADDEEKRLVYGVVYEPNVIDAHGDYMTEEEIERAAHNFLANYRNIDVQHNFKAGFGEVVESYIAKQDDPEYGIVKGSWVLVTRASEEVWEKIQKGEITGYSMAGTAEVIEKEESFLSKMARFFGFEKAGRKISAARLAELKTARDKLNQIIAEAENQDEEVTEEMKEQLDKIAKALESVTARLEALEKAQEEVQKQEEQVQKQEQNQTEELLKQLLDKVDALNSRLEVVEKSRGISKSIDTEDIKKQENKKEVPHWSSILL